MTPYFSIIMPAYNSASFIEETLRSIASQTFSDFEVLIIDDASTDNTAEIVENKARQDSRFRLIRSVHQGKPSILRNGAAKEARGRYLAFCDSDDLLTPHALSRKHDFFGYCPEAGLVFSDYVYLRENNGLWREDNKSYFEGIARFFDHLDSAYVKRQQEQFMVFGLTFWHLLAVKLMIHTSTVAMRRDLFDTLGGFAEHRLYGEDWDLWIRAAKQSMTGAVNEVHCLKRQRNESLTAKQQIHFLDAIEQQIAFLRHENLPRKIRSLLKHEIAKKAFHLGTGSFRMDQMAQARKWFSTSLLSLNRPVSSLLYLLISIFPVSVIRGIRKLKNRRKP